MTEIQILRKKGDIIYYKGSGHSGYGYEGEDILCAAISTALQMCLAGIQEVAKLCPKFKIDDDGFLEVDLRSSSEKDLSKVKILTESMCLVVRELEKEYPKHIKIVEKEES